LGCEQLTRNKIFLLDSESVPEKVLLKYMSNKPIGGVDNTSTLVIFKRCNYLSDRVIKYINHLKTYFKEVLIETFDYPPTKNALDFYITTSLGMLSVLHEDTDFILLTHDSGFAPSLLVMEKYRLKNNRYNIDLLKRYREGL
jgi:hypothetical protein